MGCCRTWGITRGSARQFLVFDGSLSGKRLLAMGQRRWLDLRKVGVGILKKDTFWRLVVLASIKERGELVATIGIKQHAGKGSSRWGYER